MKSRLICLLSILTLVPTIQTTSAEELFPDEALEAVVRQQVFAKRDNEEPLTKEDVKDISGIRGKAKGIKNLEGLQYCVALQELDLEDNEIIDIGPLSGLKLLLSINLAGNKISSLEPLADMDRVQYLELSRNHVEDLNPLAKMTNMRSLYLSDNHIRRLKVLNEFPKVWTLYAANNPIKNFGPIGRLKWLSSLDLQRTQLEDLSFLEPLTELKYVNLRDNKVQSLEPLVKMATADEQRRFSPFWRIYLKGNPLDAHSENHMEKLSELGARIKMD